MENVQILLAEDDYLCGSTIKKHLEEVGYKVTHCYDGDVAWKKFQRDDFDVCIVNVNMPKKDGITLAQDIRKRNGVVPLIFIAAKASDEERVQGFRMGADDFLVKPFSFKELVMRVKVFLRRTLPKEMPGDGIYRIGQVNFHYEEKELVRVNETEPFATLTKKEAKVLKYLVENSNKLVKRDEILLKVWGNSSIFSSRSMDVFLTRLRKYFRLEPGVDLETLHNVGIRLNIPVIDKPEAEPEA
jgi:two-component system, OmpR family, response regulator VicR